LVCRRPLYVIDGIIRDQATFVALNVNDVAEISFLKDASATAVYGAASAAGIVLVTTKQGGIGKPKFTIHTTERRTHLVCFQNWLTSYQKALAANAIGEAKGNGKNSAYSQSQLDEIKSGTNPDLYPNT
jgi:TonB-dependent SusC/RagA subfamily outer membrane receptor